MKSTIIKNKIEELEDVKIVVWNTIKVFLCDNGFNVSEFEDLKEEICIDIDQRIESLADELTKYRNSKLGDFAEEIRELKAENERLKDELEQEKEGRDFIDEQSSSAIKELKQQLKEKDEELIYTYHNAVLDTTHQVCEKIREFCDTEYYFDFGQTEGFTDNRCIELEVLNNFLDKIEKGEN